MKREVERTTTTTRLLRVWSELLDQIDKGERKLAIKSAFRFAGDLTCATQEQLEELRLFARRKETIR